MGLSEAAWPLDPCKVKVLVPPDVEATLLRMFDILENVALTLKAPALLAVNLAAMTPAGVLATYSRLKEQFISIQYLTFLFRDTHVYVTPL